MVNSIRITAILGLFFDLFSGKNQQPLEYLPPCLDLSPINSLRLNGHFLAAYFDFSHRFYTQQYQP